MKLCRALTVFVGLVLSLGAHATPSWTFLGVGNASFCSVVGDGNPYCALSSIIVDQEAIHGTGHVGVFDSGGACLDAAHAIAASLTAGASGATWSGYVSYTAGDFATDCPGGHTAIGLVLNEYQCLDNSVHDSSAGCTSDCSDRGAPLQLEVPVGSAKPTQAEYMHVCYSSCQYDLDNGEVYTNATHDAWFLRGLYWPSNYSCTGGDGTHPVSDSAIESTPQSGGTGGSTTITEGSTSTTSSATSASMGSAKSAMEGAMDAKVASIDYGTAPTFEPGGGRWMLSLSSILPAPECSVDGTLNLGVLGGAVPYAINLCPYVGWVQDIGDWLVYVGTLVSLWTMLYARKEVS